MKNIIFLTGLLFSQLSFAETYFCEEQAMPTPASSVFILVTGQMWGGTTPTGIILTKRVTETQWTTLTTTADVNIATATKPLRISGPYSKADWTDPKNAKECWVQVPDIYNLEVDAKNSLLIKQVDVLERNPNLAADQCPNPQPVPPVRVKLNCRLF